MAPSKNRVKVYHLNGEGSWEDQGTGYASISEKCIYCHAEEQGTQLILEAPISQDDIYQRQGETIISWNDPSVGMDLALSFQDSENCQVVWEELCAVQGRADAGSFRGESPTYSGVEEGAGPNGVDLPEPDMDHLEELAKLVENCTMFQRDAIAQAFNRQGYVKKLLDLFSMCDDLENKEGLQHMFRIFKGAIMLNDNCLLEMLLSDEFLMEIVGCLETDPELMERQKHREFLTKTVAYKEVVPIRDERVSCRIHQNFRVSYLRDVILAKYLDDHTFASLNSLVFFNNVEIVNRLQQDGPFLDELFSRLFANDVELSTLRDLVAFVQELCSLAKNLQMMSRNQFYRALTERNLFKLFETCLGHTDLPVRLSTIDIINGFLVHESSVCRGVMMTQQPQCSLFGILVNQLFGDTDAGMKTQIAEVIRMILDPELMEGACEKDDFLNVFYDNYMERLVLCITSEQAVREKMAAYKDHRATQVDSDESLVAHTRNQVCEILAFCVQSHGYRIKYFILRHNIVQKALGLVTPSAKASHLTMAVIRFVRACVGLKDEFYNRHMVKNNLFEPVIATFVANGSKYNLLNSAVVEMIDFIRRENVKTLVTHLVESYRDKFTNIAYVSTFNDLILRFEQNQEGEEGGHQEAAATRVVPRRRAAESDDEAYFNESDDETPEEQQETGTGLVKLVAYGDDDDESSPAKPIKRQKLDAE